MRPHSPRHGRSYSPRSSRSRSPSYSRSRSPSYSRRRRRSPSNSPPPYRSNNGGYRRRYYSRSPPPLPRPLRRYRSRSPPMRRGRPNKDCRVYVSNLSFDVTWPQLKDFMREAGQVVHVDVLKMANGRSKGCGVVEYRFPEDARRAIHTMNKTEFMGRPVFIREDREYEHLSLPKDPRDAPDDCRLHVSNLPLNASWQDMKDLFRKAGRVLHTDIHTDAGSRRSNGHGTVIFDDARYAKIAIEMFHGYEWQGHQLQVEEGRYIEKSAPAPMSNRPPLPSHVPRHSMDAPRINPTTSTPVPVALPPVPTPITHIEPIHEITPTLSYPSHPPPPPPSSSSLESIPTYQQHVYRYGETQAPMHLPPPPPVYSFVGGPAANLPTHGHNQIFVNNLPFSTTWQDLIDLFRHVGPVIRSEILTVNGHPKGSGFVRFEDATTCEKAIEKFHGYMYGGRYLDIRLDKYSTTI
ncbi:uncharacterized protein B0P05DRAFT_535864 [Gilbertella persicaria]|uniref:uncharacterized protein n=1 Tax=Gilbertella persicaria TaxID=101096 RepID=UPI00221E756C|nr:uncharacterized protein B0P05DRAFT_535864 [Gilbertella persicaria]KAI8084020.1 hypothetical protein B0P05DRAFT_535864 [Gilbertella persicaria]